MQKVLAGDRLMYCLLVCKSFIVITKYLYSRTTEVIYRHPSLRNKFKYLYLEKHPSTVV